jgi:hypothetical protein
MGLMKAFKYLIGAGVLSCAVFSNAAVIDFEYQYDGSSLSLVNGPSELIGTALAVGDTVNLQYTALGAGSYWDFSTVGNSEGNVNLGFEYASSCGTRSSHGAYSAHLDGSTLLTDSYSVGSQSCIHLGPNNIDFSSVSMLDVFSISYVLDSSTAPNDIIGNYADDTWWQVWELFGGDVEFVFVPDRESVPEPAGIALLALGLLGLGYANRRRLKA